MNFFRQNLLSHKFYKTLCRTTRLQGYKVTGLCPALDPDNNVWAILVLKWHKGGQNYAKSPKQVIFFQTRRRKRIPLAKTFGFLPTFAPIKWFWVSSFGFWVSISTSAWKGVFMEKTIPFISKQTLRHLLWLGTRNKCNTQPCNPVTLQPCNQLTN